MLNALLRIISQVSLRYEAVPIGNAFVHGCVPLRRRGLDDARLYHIEIYEGLTIC